MAVVNGWAGPPSKQLPCRDYQARRKSFENFWCLDAIERGWPFLLVFAQYSWKRGVRFMQATKSPCLQCFVVSFRFIGQTQRRFTLTALGFDTRNRQSRRFLELTQHRLQSVLEKCWPKLTTLHTDDCQFGQWLCFRTRGVSGLIEFTWANQSHPIVVTGLCLRRLTALHVLWYQASTPFDV
jgi:hypothetical protein